MEIEVMVDGPPGIGCKNLVIALHVARLFKWALDAYTNTILANVLDVFVTEYAFFSVTKFLVWEFAGGQTLHHLFNK